MKRAISFIYGIVACLLVTAAFVYLIGFIGNLVVPKSIDSGVEVTVALAIPVNLALITLFAVQHSGMARQGFKRLLGNLLPRAVERSTYLLMTTVVLGLIFWLWQPLPATVWHVANDVAQAVLYTLFGLGWVLILVSIHAIDFWGFFGLRQVHAYLKERHEGNPRFVTPLFYRFLRHPMYLGLFFGFWATPTMTVGHLLFAVTMTVYIIGAVRLEEKDLAATLGAPYREYQREVPMLMPLPGRRAVKSRASAAR